MLTCLWTGGLQDTCVMVSSLPLPHSALEDCKASLVVSLMSSCPFLLFLHACPRNGPNVQMESPGLPVTALI